MTLATCNMCSSPAVTITYDVSVENSVFDQYVCNVCGYTWLIDNNPLAYPKVGLHVDEKIQQLKADVAALQSIIDYQADTISNLLSSGESVPMGVLKKRELNEQGERWSKALLVPVDARGDINDR